jgi:hypothetical protein
MSTFTFPVPAEVLAVTSFDWQRAPHIACKAIPDAPAVVIKQIRAVRGDRGIIPAGAFVMCVKFPCADAPERYSDAWGAISFYVLRVLQRAGALDDRFSAFSYSFEPAEVAAPEVEVGLTQLCWPDGTPAVLPRKETPCTA